MNILFLSPRFYPYIGGVEKHVMEVSKRLQKQGNSVSVITEIDKKGNSVKPHEKLDGIEIYRIQVDQENWFKKFTIWFWLLKHSRLIKDADVIHAHDVFYWLFPFRVFMMRKKMFVTFHGYETYPVKYKAIIVRKISELLSNGNIIVGSYIQKWYKTKADCITYGGVKELVESKKVSNKYSALFYGRLDEHTGISTYLETVHLVKRKIPQFEFVVIGEGALKKEIEKNNSVRGFRQNVEKLLSVYHFAFVSRYLSILEAMVARRLVFAVYDNEIKKDYLESSPFAKYMIIEKNAGKLAEQILYFIRHPNEERVITNRAYEIAKSYTWEEVLNKYIKLWQK